MTAKERQLLHMLNNGVNSFDQYFDESADAPSVPSQPLATMDLGGQNTLALGQSKYNPKSQAQFDVSISLLYFQVAAGVWTQKTPAQIAAASGTLVGDLPACVFGQSDFAAGFAYFQGANQISTWAYRNPFIYGNGNDAVNVNGTNTPIDATVTALLSKGDLVQPFYATIAGPAYYVAMTVVHCTQVAYGTLLQSLASDRFLITGLRYSISDTNLLAQFSNAITPARQNNFGVVKKDTVTPLSYKQPQNFQSGIIDIPLKYGIDKSTQLSVYLDYTMGQTITWTMFVTNIERLNAA